MEIVNDFLIEEDNRTEWIGICIKVNKRWLFILNKNVHNWLKRLDDYCYIGFR